MIQSDAHYHVTLRKEDGDDVAFFPAYDLPSPGLLYDLDGRRWPEDLDGTRWRVISVALTVPSDDQPPTAADCRVVLDARWNPETERWEQVT